MAANPNSKKEVLLWVIFLLVVIILVAIILVWRNNTNRSLDNLAALAVPPIATSTSPVFQAHLVVKEQLPGTVVYLEQVVVNDGAWVVIQADADGRPGVVLGAGYFDPRVTKGAVDLSEATLAGQTYWATLYHDSGDQHFTPPSDLIWLDGTNQPIRLRFSVPSQLLEEKG